MILVGPRLPDLFEETPDCPAVELVRDRAGYFSAVPGALKDAGVWTMFGGAFIWTSDGRFPNDYPIPLHDRVETNR